MPHLQPFVAARPDPARVALESFLAPPYDVISTEQRAQLAATGPNIVELTLPQDPDRYVAAARTLDAWLAGGTLTRDAEPAMYLYEQTASIHGERIVTRGLLAAVRLDAPEDGGVRPHERVYEDVVTDRLELLRATRCDLEPILVIYDGDGSTARKLLDEVHATPPGLEVTTPFDGDTHRLWPITDAVTIDALQTDLAARTTVIADGHHRWTTARRAATERGNTGSMLMLLQDTGAWSPALLAIHRIVTDRTLDEVAAAARTLGSVTEITAADPDAWARALAASGEPGFICFDGVGAVQVHLTLPADAAPRERLDVTILHEQLFDRLLAGASVTYAHTPNEVSAGITRDGGVGILMRPTPLAAVLEIAGAGEPLPRKSTFFLPKPVSGLVLRPEDANRTDRPGV
jgi:uncharacterized protein (DUF1015 family)